jgi:hypothetical protein
MTRKETFRLDADNYRRFVSKFALALTTQAVVYGRSRALVMPDIEVQALCSS